jgi:hypothetical protein
MTGSGSGPVVSPGLYAGTGGFAGTSGLATNYAPPWLSPPLAAGLPQPGIVSQPLPFTIVQAGAPLFVASETTANYTLPQATGSQGPSTLVACIATTDNATLNPHISGITLGGSADNWASVKDFVSSTVNDAAVWYDPSCASGQTSVVLSFTAGGGTTPGLNIEVYEVLGILVPDQVSSASGSASTTWTSGTTPTLTQTPEIAFAVSNSSASQPVVTGVGSWVTQGTSGAGSFTTFGYQDPAAGSTVTFSGTITSSTYGSVIATFYIAPSGGSSAPVAAGSRHARFQRYPDKARQHARIKFSPVVPHNRPAGTRGAVPISLPGRTRQGRATPANIIISPSLPPVTPRRVQRPPPIRHAKTALVLPSDLNLLPVVQPLKPRRVPLIRRFGKSFTPTLPQVNPPIATPAPSKPQRRPPTTPRSRQSIIAPVQFDGLTALTKLRRVLFPRRGRTSPITPVATVAPPSLPTLAPRRVQRQSIFRRGRLTWPVPLVLGPQTTLFNTAEGITPTGTTLTTGNTGGLSGNAYNSIFIGTNATLVSDTSQAAHGGTSVQVATGTTATTAIAEWTTSLGTQYTAWFRIYCLLTATPTLGWRAFTARSSSAHAASLLFSGTAIQLAAGPAFSVPGGATFTTPLPIGQWFRVEGFFIGDAANGAVSASIYTSMDSYTPNETRTVTSINTTGPLTQYWFGQSSSVANTGPFWFDDVGLSSVGPIGPVQPAPPPFVPTHARRTFPAITPRRNQYVLIASSELPQPVPRKLLRVPASVRAKTKISAPAAVVVTPPAPPTPAPSKPQRRWFSPGKSKSSINVVPPQVNPPIAPSAPNKTRRLPLLRRAKTGQLDQIQIAGGPPMPTSAPNKTRRAPLLRRGKSFSPVPLQVNPPLPLSAPNKPRRALFLRRSRTFTATPPEHSRHAQAKRRSALIQVPARRTRATSPVPPEHSRHAFFRKRGGAVQIPPRKSKAAATITPQPVIAPKLPMPFKSRHVVGLYARRLLKKLAFPFFVATPARQPQNLGGTELDANLLGGTATVLTSLSVYGTVYTGTYVQLPDVSGTAVNNNVLGGTAIDPNIVEGGAVVEQNVLGGTLAIVDPFTSTAIGWTMQEVDIHLAEFNDETLNLTITSGGTAQNLTGIELDMFLKTKAGVLDTDPSTIKLSTVTGEIVITNAPSGLVTVSIPATDLAGIGIGFYRVDLFVGGKRNTAIYGTVTITSL